MGRRAASPNALLDEGGSDKESKPPISRRVEVADDISLARLHHIIQAAMGWTDSHLHMFNVGRVSYGVPDPDYDEDVRDERRYKLNQLLTAPKQKLSYEYDAPADKRRYEPLGGGEAQRVGQGQLGCAGRAAGGVQDGGEGKVNRRI